MINRVAKPYPLLFPAVSVTMNVKTRLLVSTHFVGTLVLVEAMPTAKLSTTGQFASARRATMEILRLLVSKLVVSQTVSAKKLMLADPETAHQVTKGDLESFLD